MFYRLSCLMMLGQYLALEVDQHVIGLPSNGAPACGPLDADTVFTRNGFFFNGARGTGDQQVNNCKLEMAQIV